MGVRFIGGSNRSTLEKTTDLSLLTNFITYSFIEYTFTREGLAILVVQSTNTMVVIIREIIVKITYILICLLNVIVRSFGIYIEFSID